MVHNGIEYGDMQLISEAYFMMKELLHMSDAEMGDVFAEWNKGLLDSYLIEITSKILKVTDKETGKPLLEMILDKAGQKGLVNGQAKKVLNLVCQFLRLQKLYLPVACRRINQNV